MQPLNLGPEPESKIKLFFYNLPICGIVLLAAENGLRQKGRNKKKCDFPLQTGH
jgi:hypothetical protein